MTDFVKIQGLKNLWTRFPNKQFFFNCADIVFIEFKCVATCKSLPLQILHGILRGVRDF